LPRTAGGRKLVAAAIVGLAREMLEQRLSVVEKGPLFTLENGTVLTSSHVGRFLLARANRLPVAKFTSHDLRRSATTYMAEMWIALDVIAAVIGHESLGSKDIRILRRHYVHTDLLERKTHALQTWSDRLRGIVMGEETAKVVPLTRRA
jgi:integrase